MSDDSQLIRREKEGCPGGGLGEVFLHKNKDGVGWGGVGWGQGNAERNQNESIPHPTTLYISHIVCDKSGIDKIFRSSECLEWFA